MARRSQNVLIIGRGGSAVGLGWLIVSMVYLAVLASAGAFRAQSVAEHWSLSLADVVTVQVPSAGVKAGETTRLGSVLEVLRTSDRIDDVVIFDAERTRNLLDPWIGSRVVFEVPMPVMIDVRLVKNNGPDLAALRDRLDTVAPGTEVSDHGPWLIRIAAVTAAASYGCWLIVLLVGTVAVISVVFAVIAGLAGNRDTVALLHLMGARDSFVAGRFQNYVLRVALPACVIGGILAAMTVLVVAQIGSVAGPMTAPATSDFNIPSDFQGFFGSGILGAPVELFGMQVSRWTGVAMVPAGFLLIAVLAARLSVLVVLRRSV